MVRCNDSAFGDLRRELGESQALLILAQCRLQFGKGQLFGFDAVRFRFGNGGIDFLKPGALFFQSSFRPRRLLLLKLYRQVEAFGRNLNHVKISDLRVELAKGLQLLDSSRYELQRPGQERRGGLVSRCRT